ncbi:hypothetical protein [Geodermatophilus sp. SYSU D01176]
MSAGPRRVGMAVVGLGGAVATTAVAGLELLRTGGGAATGLPLAGLEVEGRPVEGATGLAGYTGLVVGAGTSTAATCARPLSGTASSTTTSWSRPGRTCPR